MSVNAGVEGRTYGMSATHLVTREEVVAFADAVRAPSSVHRDVVAARSQGYSDVVATPTFAVKIAQQAEAQFMADPEARVDFARLLHGEETFVHHAPIVAGDELTAQTRVQRIRSAGGHQMVTLETTVKTVAGEDRTTATSLVVIRGEEASA